jgi:hypothetical protein
MPCLEEGPVANITALGIAKPHLKRSKSDMLERFVDLFQWYDPLWRL